MKKIKYTFSLDTVPKSWKSYFSKSKVGNTYDVLVNDKNEIVMSNTEIEIITNQVIIDKAYGDVLLIGLGINLINDLVLESPNVSSVDTVENNQWIIDNIPTKTNILFGDYQTYKYPKLYDIIWFDAYDQYDNKNLLPYLKENGQILTWSILIN